MWSSSEVVLRNSPQTHNENHECGHPAKKGRDSQRIPFKGKSQGFTASSQMLYQELSNIFADVQLNKI
jgi:hypothetical protein